MEGSWISWGQLGAPCTSWETRIGLLLQAQAQCTCCTYGETQMELLVQAWGPVHLVVQNTAAAKVQGMDTWQSPVGFFFFSIFFHLFKDNACT